ncbi:MAG: hypothetical protein LUE93_11680 [Bacteroides sp.]|nr:hypothetical protein [Bacteroides sp.]
MENGNAIPLQGNSTMVLVKAQYTPAEWLDREGNITKSPSLDGTFWRIKNASGTYRSGYYAEEPVVPGSQTVERYEGGITYYPIWLETEGKYMVERNHYYKLAITEVISAGANSLKSVMSPETTLTTNTTRSTAFGKSLPEAATTIRWIQKN